MNPPATKPLKQNLMNANPTSNFERLAVEIELASYALNHAAKLYEGQTRAEEEAWLAGNKIHKNALDSICIRWSKERGSFPDMPPLQEYYLWVRLFAAVEFLHQCDMPEDNTLLPYPKASDQEMIKWLLVDWWERNGKLATLYSYDFPFRRKSES